VEDAQHAIDRALGAQRRGLADLAASNPSHPINSIPSNPSHLIDPMLEGDLQPLQRVHATRQDLRPGAERPDKHEHAHGGLVLHGGQQRRDGRAHVRRPLALALIGGRDDSGDPFAGIFERREQAAVEIVEALVEGLLRDARQPHEAIHGHPGVADFTDERHRRAQDSCTQRLRRPDTGVQRRGHARGLRACCRGWLCVSAAGHFADRGLGSDRSHQVRTQKGAAAVIRDQGRGARWTAMPPTREPGGQGTSALAGHRLFAVPLERRPQGL